MRYTLKSWTLLILMAVAATTGWAMRPTHLIADQRPKIELEKLVPIQFGDWRELKQSNGQIVNPQQEALLAKIYSQTLTRSYINSAGAVVMLSIAYGTNQSDDLAFHYPELCYPAQGFEVTSKDTGRLETSINTIIVNRLVTKLKTRHEPVTYWTVLGDDVVEPGLATKLSQIRFGIKRQVPDGLIFRVSSIDTQTKTAFSTHDGFAIALAAAIPTTSGQRLFGKSTVDCQNFNSFSPTANSQPSATYGAAGFLRSKC